MKQGEQVLSEKFSPSATKDFISKDDLEEVNGEDLLPVEPENSADSDVKPTRRLEVDKS